MNNRVTKEYPEATVPQCTKAGHQTHTCPYFNDHTFEVPDIDPYANLPNPEDLIHGNN
jgi:hypothetical protein